MSSPPKLTELIRPCPPGRITIRRVRWLVGWLVRWCVSWLVNIQPTAALASRRPGGGCMDRRQACGGQINIAVALQRRFAPTSAFS